MAILELTGKAHICQVFPMPWGVFVEVVWDDHTMIHRDTTGKEFEVPLRMWFKLPQDFPAQRGDVMETERTDTTFLRTITTADGMTTRRVEAQALQADPRPRRSEED